MADYSLYDSTVGKSFREFTCFNFQLSYANNVWESNMHTNIMDVFFVVSIT